jgi:hypothetical protein
LREKVQLFEIALPHLTSPLNVGELRISPVFRAGIKPARLDLYYQYLLDPGFRRGDGAAQGSPA